jgi:hypothetical protein
MQFIQDNLSLVLIEEDDGSEGEWPKNSESNLLLVLDMFVSIFVFCSLLWDAENQTDYLIESKEEIR